MGRKDFVDEWTINGEKYLEHKNGWIIKESKLNNMERKEGYYWVMIDGVWEILEWYR